MGNMSFEIAMRRAADWRDLPIALSGASLALGPICALILQNTVQNFKNMNLFLLSLWALAVLTLLVPFVAYVAIIAAITPLEALLLGRRQFLVGSLAMMITGFLGVMLYYNAANHGWRVRTLYVIAAYVTAGLVQSLPAFL